MEQEHFVGLDVSQAETSVCVVDGAGKVVWLGKCTSTPEAMAATVRRRAPHIARIALETGPMSAWHYRSLAALGLPVVCIDARHAKAALAMRLNKTDANDAVGLAQDRAHGLVSRGGRQKRTQPSDPRVAGGPSETGRDA